MSAWDGGDRFSLLFLEEGEYYFRDYNANYWHGSDNRLVGYLKVCSASLYFVPKDVNEPIFRVPYRHVASITRLNGEKSPSGEELFSVCASERVDMQKGNKSMPYVRHRGDFEFRFSLVYADLSDFLPLVEELNYIVHLDQTDEPQGTAAKLAKVIQAHEENETFNVGWLEDENEKILFERTCSNVTPLCNQPGRVVVTYCRLYFQPFNVVSNKPIHTYSLSKVTSVVKRTYQLQEVGVEVFFGHPKDSLYLAFNTVTDREEMLTVLLVQPELRLDKQRSLSTVTAKWVKGKVSNFDYLMFLNREAGRSFKDLTQYPIFPWVIKDYESDTLDLTDNSVYRDLTKPIGALNPKRFAEFKERYDELKKMNQKSGAAIDDGPWGTFFPPFLYGCHYSTPGYVVYFLLRSEPQLMLKLQNGRFDTPDRLFWSIADTWNSVMTLPTDVKELIPEFYANDVSFLVNAENIDFGKRSEGVAVNDVVLPPWACSATDYLQRLAEALESPFVSKQLHKWINLIFGYKSQLPNAEKADNVFHYLTYDDIAIAYLEREKDPVLREALKVQMMEFGRTPKRLFASKHSKRKVSYTHQQRFGCISLGPSSRKPRPTNALTFRGATLRSVDSGARRAVAKLTSSKFPLRNASLEWLENAASNRDPDFLEMQRSEDFIPLLQAVEPLPLDDIMWTVFARAMRVLCVAEVNCQLLLGAGALEEVAKAASCPGQETRTFALDALVNLTHYIDERRTLSEGGIDVLVHAVSSQHTTHDNKKNVAKVLKNLATKNSTNRALIAATGGLPALVCLLDDQHSEDVRAAAAAALVALLQEDSLKEQVVSYHIVTSLLALCEEQALELRSLAAECLAALSTHDTSRTQMMSNEVLGVLSSFLRSDHIALKRHAAAAVANLTSDPSLLHRVQNMDWSLLQSIVSAAYSDDPEVQRHAARAFWHLVVHDTSRPYFINQGGLQALIRLSQSGSRGVQAKPLAKQSLRYLADSSPVLRDRLEDLMPGIIQRISHSRLKSVSSQFSMSSLSIHSTEQDETSGSWTPGRSALSQSSAHARSRSSPDNAQNDGEGCSSHQRNNTVPLLEPHFLPSEASSSTPTSPTHNPTSTQQPQPAGSATLNGSPAAFANGTSQAAASTVGDSVSSRVPSLSRFAAQQNDDAPRSPRHAHNSLQDPLSTSFGNRLASSDSDLETVISLQHQLAVFEQSQGSPGQESSVPKVAETAMGDDEGLANQPNRSMGSFRFHHTAPTVPGPLFTKSQDGASPGDRPHTPTDDMTSWFTPRGEPPTSAFDASTSSSSSDSIERVQGVSAADELLDHQPGVAAAEPAEHVPKSHLAAACREAAEGAAEHSAEGSTSGGEITGEIAPGSSPRSKQGNPPSPKQGLIPVRLLQKKFLQLSNGNGTGGSPTARGTV